MLLSPGLSYTPVRGGWFVTVLAPATPGIKTRTCWQTAPYQPRQHLLHTRTPTNIITITTLGARNKYDPGITVHYSDRPSRPPLEGIYKLALVRLCQNTYGIRLCVSAERFASSPDDSNIARTETRRQKDICLHTHSVLNFYNTASHVTRRITVMIETDAEISWRAKDTFAGRAPHVRRETSSLVAITCPYDWSDASDFHIYPRGLSRVQNGGFVYCSLVTTFCIETRLGQIVGAPSKRKLTILYLVNINNIGWRSIRYSGINDSINYFIVYTN